MKSILSFSRAIRVYSVAVFILIGGLAALHIAAQTVQKMFFVPEVNLAVMMQPKSKPVMLPNSVIVHTGIAKAKGSWDDCHLQSHNPLVISDHFDYDHVDHECHFEHSKISKRSKSILIKTYISLAALALIMMLVLV